MKLKILKAIGILSLIGLSLTTNSAIGLLLLGLIGIIHLENT